MAASVGLPEGFKLDANQDLPEGFTLDAEEKGFFGRLGDDYQNRLNQVSQVRQDVNNGKVNPVMGTAGFVGKGVLAPIGDVMTEGLHSAGNYLSDALSKETGSVIFDPLAKAINKPPELRDMPGPIKEKGLYVRAARLLNKVGSAYDSTLESHPNVKLGLETAGNAFMAAPVFEGIGAGTKAAIKGVDAFKASRVVPTSEAAKEVASSLYKTADDLGGTLKPEFRDKYLDRINGIVVPRTLDGQVLAGNSPGMQMLSKMESLRGQPMSLQSAQEIDELLGEAIDGFYELGKLKKEGLPLLSMQKTLRNQIDNATEADIVGSKNGFDALRAGRREWHRSAKLRDVEKIIARAQTDNPAKSLATGFKNLINNDSKLRGFTQEERFAIRKAAKTGAVTDLLRTIGSRLNTTAGAAVGASGAINNGDNGVSVDPIEALTYSLLGAGAAHVVGAGARNLANTRQMGKANNVLRTIDRAK